MTGKARRGPWSSPKHDMPSESSGFTVFPSANVLLWTSLWPFRMRQRTHSLYSTLITLLQSRNSKWGRNEEEREEGGETVEREQGGSEVHVKGQNQPCREPWQSLNSTAAGTSPAKPGPPSLARTAGSLAEPIWSSFLERRAHAVQKSLQLTQDGSHAETSGNSDLLRV